VTVRGYVALGPRALSLPASELLFVSSTAWDVAGAKVVASLAELPL
jgi:hypothetical protein